MLKFIDLQTFVKLGECKLSLKTIFHSIFCLWILTSTSWSQDRDPEVFRRAEAYAQQYERIIHQAVADYYFKETFIVDARVTLDEMIVPLEYEKRRQDIDDDVTELPGLPVIPNEWRNPTKDSLSITEFRRDFGIKYVDVTVLVDTSYQIEDVGFVVELIKMTANLEDIRGDRVSIKKKVFPETFESHRKVDEIPLSSEIPQAQESKSLSDSLLSELPILLPLILVFLFLGVLIWMILKYLKQSDQGGEATQKHMETIMFQIQELKNFQKPAEPKESEISIEKTPEYQALRNYVLDSFIGRPQPSSKILNNWIQLLGDKGLKDAAQVVTIVDDKILEILAPSLGNSSYDKLSLRLQTLEDIEGEVKIELLGQFRKDMEALLGSHAHDDKTGDIFNFLNQLSSRQLRHVLKGESTGIQGLALAQLPPEKAAEILQTMEEPERTGVLVSMGQIENVSVQSYKDVAKSLSRKALEVSNMKYVAADGVESILDVIIDLPTESQKRYLQNIAEMDLSLAEKIRRFYLPFEDLVQVSKKQLLEFIQDFDRDELSIALLNVPEELLNHFIQAMPDRMGQAVLAGIESSVDAGGDQVEVARHKLLKHIRKEIALVGGLES